MQFASWFNGRQFMKIISLVLSLVLMAVSFQADAKRLGGGRSVGQQSGSVTQREASRPAATPGQNAAPAAPAAPPVQQPQRRPWGAMMGGLAAGLGLAWLAHSLGFGAELGQFLMFGLLALGVITEARARNIAVPAQLSVMGFGDVPFVADMVPALTTVQVHGGEIGTLAAQHLIARLQGHTMPDPIVNVGFSIVERESA